jgi:3-oxoacyl-[acyl-carrier protein] reductase
MNQIDLNGRCAVVTGGAQGIGEATAQRFVKSGAKVGLWDRDAKLLELARAQLAEWGEVHAVEADVTDPQAVTAAVEDTQAALGPIDILINNAGIAGATTVTWHYPLDQWQRVLDTNLAHRQRRLDRRQGRQPQRLGLQRRQGRGDRADQVAG